MVVKSSELLKSDTLRTQEMQQHFAWIHRTKIRHFVPDKLKGAQSVESEVGFDTLAWIKLAAFPFLFCEYVITCPCPRPKCRIRPRIQHFSSIKPATQRVSNPEAAEFDPTTCAEPRKLRCRTQKPERKGFRITTDKDLTAYKNYTLTASFKQWNKRMTANKVIYYAAVPGTHKPEHVFFSS